MLASVISHYPCFWVVGCVGARLWQTLTWPARDGAYAPNGCPAGRVDASRIGGPDRGSQASQQDAR